MRMLFGGATLVAFLIAMLIYAFVWSKNTQTDLTAAQPAIKQARQLAGVDANGVHIQNSITFDPVMNGPQLFAIKVRTIMPGGPMATYFGLAPGDQIVQFRHMKIGELANNDPDLAISLIFQAYTEQTPLTVDRGGTRIELPATGTPSTPSVAPVRSSPQNPAAVLRQLQGQ